LPGATGCGDNKSKDFRTDYNKIVREYSSLPVDVGTAIRGASSKSDKQLATQFGDLSDRISQEVAKLKKLDPPDGAKNEFDAFVGGLDKVGGDLRSISDAAKAHSSSRAKAGARALLQDAKQVSRQEDALKKAVD
jgi:hypothetical protein